MSDDKLNLSEHVNALFEGVEVSDEQKAKMETVLEAAVTSVVATEKLKIQEGFDAKVEALVEAKSSDIESVVNKYLDYVITEWVEDNKLALESGLKVEMAESFFDGFKSLMAEHNVTVPEGKEDVLVTQEAEIKKLKDSLNESKAREIELTGEIESRDRENLIGEASDGLTDTQKEKFATMIEGIEFKDSVKFKEKLGIIRESYFKSDDGKGKPADTKPALIENLNENLDPQQSRLNRIRNPYKS